MHERAVVIQRPEHASKLVLLFHGVGSSARDLVPLGEVIAGFDARTMIVSADAPHPSTFGRGREWFSVAGITEENRPDRIARALPLFHETVVHWQQESGLGSSQTTAIGFSQGAIIALESTQVTGPPLVNRVVALAGRFAVPVRRVAPELHFHLIHGEADAIVPAHFAVSAAEALGRIGASVTLDVLPDLGHQIDARVLNLLRRYLR